MKSDQFPSHWSLSTLGQVADPLPRSIISGPFGSNIGRRFFVDKGVPVIRGSNLTTDTIRLIDSGFVFVTEQKANELNTFAVADDLVFTAAGTLGQVGIIPGDATYSRYIISNKQLRVRVDRSRIDPLFAFYWFSSRQMVQYIAQRNTGSTIPLINLSVLRALPIPVPPIEEQRDIAHILGTLDDKIELNRQMNQGLDEMARTLFRSWFVDFDPVRAKDEGRQPEGIDAETAALFPDRLADSELSPIPEGWVWSTVGEAFALNPARRLKQGAEATFLEMKNVATTGHRPLSLDRKPAKGGARFQNGDTLLARITPCLENGKTAYVDFLEHGEIGFGSTEYIVMSAKPPLPPLWSYLVARHELFREFAERSMTGTSGRQRVSAEAVARFPIVLPTAPVAERFGDLVEPMFAMIRANDKENHSIAQLRDLLLPELLTARITALPG